MPRYQKDSSSSISMLYIRTLHYIAVSLIRFSFDHMSEQAYIIRIVREPNHCIRNRVLYYRNVVKVDQGSYRNGFTRSYTQFVTGHQK